jgi:hypothetical protein
MSRLAPMSRYFGLLAVSGAPKRRQTHLLQEQPSQFLPTIIDPQAIGCIDNPDQRVSLFKVIPPVRSQGLLAADIPFNMGKLCKFVKSPMQEKANMKRLTNVQLVSATNEHQRTVRQLLKGDFLTLRNRSS